MKEHGFASGSAQGRGGRRAGAVWAFCAGTLLMCACSGSTDVVGVLPADGLQQETGSLEGASQGDGSRLPGGSDVTGGEGTPSGELSGEFLIVAGMPVSWEGPALLWPFDDVSLREFFSEPLSWSGRSGPPPGVERRVMEAMGKSAKADHIRVVAPPVEVVERLRDAFVDADRDFDGDMEARLMRDWRSDEYRVVLGSASCGYAPSHHVGPCAELSADGFEHP